MTRIYFHGTREDIRARAVRLRNILAGSEADTHGVARGFLIALGFGCLSDIKTAFIAKARGGTDEMGVRWPKLTPEYLAYGRRFGRGEAMRLKAASGLGKGNRLAPGGKRGLLTAAQLKRWQKIYATRLNRFLHSLPPVEAKARAAQIAWAELKREGAKTKLGVFGHRSVEILRDTGVLFNSLSPGRMSGHGPGASYSKPSGEGGDEQVFDIAAGGVTVGTNVSYAAVHNYGHASKPKMPRRQFLPDSESQIPDSWWQNWLDLAERSLQAGAAIVFRSAA